MPEQLPKYVEKPFDLMLEIVRGTQHEKVAATFLPNVHSYEKRPIPALDRRWTMRGRPMKQHRETVEEEISVSGHSGMELRDVAFFGRGTVLETAGFTPNTSDGFKADGPTRFEEFLSFLAYYYTEAGKYRSAFVRNRAKEPHLIFRFLKTGDAFYVDNVRVVPSMRTGSSRSSYEYSLTMTTEGVAERVPTSSFLTSPSLAISKSETDLKATTARIGVDPDDDDRIDFDEPVRARVAKAKALPDKLYVVPVLKVLRDLPADMDEFRSPLTNFLGRIGEYEDAIAAASRSTLGMPRAVVADIRSFAAKTEAAVYTIWDGMTAIKRDAGRGWLMQIRSSLGAVHRDATKLLGAAGTKLAPAGEAVTLADGSTTAGRVTTTEALVGNQTLQQFAQHWLGDPSRWREIAALNGMSSDTMMGDGSPLSPGQELEIPSQLPDSVELPPDDPDADIFGRDLLWSVKYLDFVPLGDPPRDIAAVSGPENLIQATTRRFTMLQGSDETAPGMGVPDTIGRVTNDALAAEAASGLVTQATADRRIKRLRRVEFQQRANIYSASLKLVPIAGRSIDLTNIKVGI